MKKKINNNRCNFFYDFPAAGNNEKKKFIMKKNFVQKIWKGYCQNRIMRGWIVLQDGEVCCNRKA